MVLLAHAGGFALGGNGGLGGNGWTVTLLPHGVFLQDHLKISVNGIALGNHALQREAHALTAPATYREALVLQDGHRMVETVLDVMHLVNAAALYEVPRLKGCLHTIPFSV